MIDKQIIFVVSHVNGGVGRVISLLSGELLKKGYAVSVIFTSDENNPDFCNNRDVETVFLSSLITKSKHDAFAASITMLFARFVGKLGFLDYSSILKFKSRNYTRVKALKRYFRKNKPSTVISFLYDAMFLSLLSVNRKNRLVISERVDPCQSLDSKIDLAFFRKMFPRADEMVFQSPDVKKWYNENTDVKGTVIYNPIKPELPLMHSGERNKNIVNFCRINSQKNLKLLIEAFSILHRDFPDYNLCIYGNAAGLAAAKYRDEVIEYANSTDCRSDIHFYPASNNIHEIIKDSAMFVSSSDFEGMSNSMLEAMAMGMPVVCTDCPAGGARAVIKDHENGLLTPVGDAEALYKAMKEVIENPDLAKKMGENAAKIKEEQSVEKITKKWMEIING